MFNIKTICYGIYYRMCAVCEGICKLLGLDDFINPTWNTNEKSYLSSRILTIKQIKEDF